MVSSVLALPYVEAGISVIAKAAAYCSPWIITAAVVSAIVIPRIFKACQRPARPPLPAEVQIPVRMNLEHPGNVFLNPARHHEMPADQEVTVAKWMFQNETREVYVLRTVQRDLICQVFDRATGRSNRRFIGERGEYSQKEAEEFIRNRVPRLVNPRNGASALFLCVHERLLKVWQTALYEIFLAHNENDGKIDWIVSFINEDRVERVAVGVARKLQPWIPFWQRNIPRIDFGAQGIVAVNFPDAAPPNLVLPVAQQVAQPLENEPMFQELSAHPKTFSLDTLYIDNIPARIASKDRSTIILGYAKEDSALTYWSYAPFKDGRVLQIDGLHFLSLFSGYMWREKPPIRLELFETSYRDQASEKNGVRLYDWGKDRTGRLYILIPANGGWVPVRHGTDPSCGNWLSKTTLTKIIYDSHRVRWPGCEGIDYRKHGFIPQDENNKTWWPIGNGSYRPSFDRLKDPYYPQHHQLNRESSRVWLIAQAALAAVAIHFGYRATLAAAKAADAYRAAHPEDYRLAPGHDVMNLNGVANGVNLAFQGVQLLAPAALHEARANEQNQARAVREYVTQKEVLETLEQQDAYDRGEEVVKAVAVADVTLVNELLQGGPIPREPRYQAIILAASSGYPNTLRALIDNADINARILKAAQCAAKENNYGSILEVLREYRNRERAVPR